MIFHEQQLKIIHLIHQLRSPVLDKFFEALDFFDRQEFFFVLIPIMWLWKGWKTGLRLYCILFLSSLVNPALKGFFLSPRPFHLDPSLGVIHVGGLGFPSGAAQTVALLSGLLLIYWKNPWKWAVAIPYILLISFSRIYLGVHFFTDILAGWLIGSLLLAIYIVVFPYIEQFFEKIKAFNAFLLSQIIPFFMLLWHYSSSNQKTYSLAMGIGLGTFLIYHNKLFLLPPKNRSEGVMRSLIGVFSTFGFYGLIEWIPLSDYPSDPFFRYYFFGVWLAFGMYLICRQLFPESETSIDTYE